MVRCVGRPLGDSWRILAMTRVVLSTISPLSRSLLTMKVGLCCVCEEVPSGSCSRAMPSVSKKSITSGTVDTKKRGRMVWRITQNVSAERARQPHNFRSPRLPPVFALVEELPCLPPAGGLWQGCIRSQFCMILLLLSQSGPRC